MRIEEGRRLLESATEKQRARIHEQVAALKRDRHLFEQPAEQLDRSDRVRINACLSRMPVLKEVYDFAQQVHRLYDRDITPRMAESHLNRLIDGLSAEAMRYLSRAVTLIRQYMPEVAAHWAAPYHHH